MGSLRWIVVTSLALTAPSLWAYVQTVTPSGQPVSWRGARHLNLAGNPINRSGIGAGDLQAAVVRSLQRWQQASAGVLGFDYWQGTDPVVYRASSDYDGMSSFYFASQAAPGSADASLSPNVLGLTQIWYETQTGQIVETDVVLNDRYFRFTTRPSDTTGYGSGGPSTTAAGLNTVYIENVLTHELGHAYGLSHGAGLQSTMLFLESPEQAHLGCDEQIGVRAMYPAADAGGRGSVTGVVVSESGDPVFGAHVQAISRRRGTAIAAGVTDASGHYRIDALEPGAYFLLIEPYFAGASALPAYYGQIKPGICSGGSLFARAFLTAADGVPQALQVGAGSQVQVPPHTARCGEIPRSARVARVAAASSAASDGMPLLSDGSGAGGFGVASRFDSSSPAYYKLRALSGQLEVHAVGYSLYSPLRARLRLLDSNGVPVEDSESIDAVYTGDSGYINYDASLEAQGLSLGDYVLEVSPDGGRAIDASRYPAATVALDATPFLLVTGSINEGAPPLAAQLPDNARCRSDERFAAYSSPAGHPPRAAVDAQEEEQGGFGFCGRVQTPGGRGPSSGGVVGWLLPWVLMAVTVRLARLSARGRRLSSA